MLLFNLLRPGPGAAPLAGGLGAEHFLKITASRTHLRASEFSSSGLSHDFSGARGQGS